MTSARLFNAYGPRQSARSVIPTVSTQLLLGMDEVKLGSLHPARYSVFVKDTVQESLDIASCKRPLGEEVNISTLQEISAGDLAHELIRQIRPPAKVVVDGQRLRPLNSAVERLLSASVETQSLTGWRPRFDPPAGLAETIEWFRIPENLARYRADVYNV